MAYPMQGISEWSIERACYGVCLNGVEGDVSTNISEKEIHSIHSNLFLPVFFQETTILLIDGCWLILGWIPVISIWGSQKNDGRQANASEAAIKLEPRQNTVDHGEVINIMRETTNKTHETTTNCPGTYLILTYSLNICIQQNLLVVWRCIPDLKCAQQRSSGIKKNNFALSPFNKCFFCIGGIPEMPKEFRRVDYSPAF